MYKVTGPKSHNGTDWQYIQIPVRRPSRKLDSNVRFIFDGIRGQSFFSDIAVDDVRLRPEKCVLMIPKDRKKPKVQKLASPTSSPIVTPKPTSKPEPAYMPEYYSNTKPVSKTSLLRAQIKKRGSPMYCKPSNEKYFSNIQICCQGRIYLKTQGDKCCGMNPIFSYKQSCCDGQIYDNNWHTCCGGKMLDRNEYACCGDTAYLRSSDKKCCIYDNYQTSLYDQKLGSRCCPSANKVYNSTAETCCGNQVNSKFNKSYKCCGPTGNQGKPYLDMVMRCCIAPPSLSDNHYLYAHWNAGSLPAVGDKSERYELINKFNYNCCEGFVYSQKNEQCVGGKISKMDKSKIGKGPPAWLTSMG